LPRMSLPRLRLWAIAGNQREKFKMHATNSILKTASEWLAEGREIAIATVIEAKGSSPQPVGSQLLMDEDGNFEGSVSGGCIEGVVVSEGMKAIALGQSQRLIFGIGRNREWDVGLACGGEIEIFVESATAHRALLSEMASLNLARQPACLVTNLTSDEKVLVKDSTTPRPLPQELQASIAETLTVGKSMICEVKNEAYFLQACFPDPEILIIGAVHIAQPLALMAQIAGYAVTIIDPREAFATQDRFPTVTMVNTPPEEVFALKRLHRRCAVVTLSHESKLDDPALMIALRSQAFYVGALGSSKTHAKRVERLEEAGLLKSEIDRLHAPVGLDIGARNATEIAIAIMAEITQCFVC
jgi:xanthine dehydrogenase accessory factor